MGFIAKRTTRDLLQPVDLPVGSWLAELDDRFPHMLLGELIHAAVLRIDATALLGKASTYVGVPGSVNTIASAFSMVPSDLVAYLRSKRTVVVACGALGWFPGGAYRQATDWAVALTVSEDRSTVRFETIDATTTDDALNNSKAFSAFRNAVADVLRTGVHLEEVDLAATGDLDRWWSLRPYENLTEVDLALSGPVVVPDAAFHVLQGAMFESALPSDLRRRLSEEGAWPVPVGDDGSRHLPATASTSTVRLIGELVQLSFTLAGDDAKDVLRELAVALQAATVSAARPGVVASGIDPASRFLPLSLSAEPIDVDPIALGRLSAARTSLDTATVSFKLRSKKQDQQLFATASRDGSNVAFGWHGRLPMAGLGSSLADEMLPMWSVRFHDGADRRIRAHLRGLTFTAGGLLPGSPQLVDLLRALAERLEGRGLRLVVLDRDRDAAGTVETRTVETGSAPPADDGVVAEDDPAATPPDDRAAAWHPDPFGRHGHRYWDGRRWTASVADDGVTARDEPGFGPPPAQPHA